MSEYMEKFCGQSFNGALQAMSAEGELTEKSATNLIQSSLFDEVEKAHLDILLTFSLMTVF